MALPEYKSQKTKVWQYLNQPLSVLKSALGITDGGGGGDFLTATVTVTANDFINASSVLVKELIPPVGAGKYLRFNTLVGKFKNATIAYDAMPSLAIKTEVGNIAGVTPLVLLGTTEQVVSSAGNGAATGINGSVYLEYKTFLGLPTVGDGNVIFEIEYEILDF
jgi:hypothetical protein